MQLKDWLQKNNITTPSTHIVLGSGLAIPLLSFSSEKIGWNLVGEVAFKDIDGLVPSTAPGHKGTFRYYTKNNKVISFQTGRLHGYEGHSPQVVAGPVNTVFESGTKKFILTNAAGSLQTHMKAGSVMMISDHFNFTGLNPLTGHNNESTGPRFPDMSQVYNIELNALIKKNLLNEKLEVHEGIYIGVNGPSFETPAETKCFSNWGMGSVGMSTVFEAISLKHRGAEIGGISFLANMGAGIGDKASGTLSGEEVLEEAFKKAPLILNALFKSAEIL